MVGFIIVVLLNQVGLQHVQQQWIQLNTKLILIDGLINTHKLLDFVLDVGNFRLVDVVLDDGMETLRM